MPEDELLKYMGPFAQYVDAQWAVDRPDVAHACGWMSGIPTQLAARHLGLPAVQTCDGLGVVPQERLQLQATVARTANWVAATRTDEVLQLMRISRARISVVPPGVDIGLFNPAGPQAPKRAKHRIVGVGKIVPRNGFDNLVRALPMICTPSW